MKNIFSFFILICLFQLTAAQENKSGITGSVFTIEDAPVSDARIFIDGNLMEETTQSDGSFEITRLSEGNHVIRISSPKFKPYSETVILGANETKEITVTLRNKGHIEKVVVIGNAKTPLGLESVTRLPLNPRDLSQTISVIPEKIIKEQGVETLTDAVRNVPGVTLFGTYGGVKESMSIRGYRGVPVLKNGIQVDSDFRTASLLSDMQGVQNVQVLKGSAAVTQGIGNGLGSPGGVINVVTKTPQFINKGEVSLKSGSWGLFRPAFDYQTVLDKKQTAALRLNGVFQRADSYKSYVNNNRIYINPSFEWRPDYRTTITLEMDYMNDNTTPDRGTVNLTDININSLYDMPHNKFMGWGTDNVNTKTTTYAAKFVRELNENLSLRAVYAGAVNEVESYGVSTSNGSNMVKRSLLWGETEDKNQTIQIDLIGKNIQTGKIKHTFQSGFDYKTSDRTNITHTKLRRDGKGVIIINSKTGEPYNDTSIEVDAINVLGSFSNQLPTNISKSSFDSKTETNTYSATYGLMVQDMIEFDKYVKATLGLRYSQSDRKVNADADNHAWNPFIGLMITPIKNISIFGNYTTTTDLRSANNPTQDGGTVGAATSNQFEVGLKTDWMKNRLGVNVTYFHIQNNDIAYQAYNNTGSTLGYYIKAGDITRKGVEVEVSGNILPELKVIAGYAYLDSQYQNSVAYVNGSRPMNAPQNTANGWLQYTFSKGTLKNLSIGTGVYYVGNRPVNDYTTDLVQDAHGTTPGLKPFNMPEYTTVNAQLGYKYKNMGFNVFFNNIFDELGYTSYYRGGYINQIDPRNFKVQVSYNF